MEESTTKQRLMEYIKYKGITPLEFTNSIGVSNAYIANMAKSMTAPILLKIKAEYPDINEEWLINGEGEMLTSDVSKSISVPLLPLCFFGVSLHDFYMNAVSCERVISPVGGANIAVQVTADDMYPIFIKGMTVLAKEVDITDLIQWGSCYLLDTEKHGVLIRCVQPVQGNDEIRLCSTCDAYPDFNIKKSAIRGWYKILASINLY